MAMTVLNYHGLRDFGMQAVLPGIKPGCLPVSSVKSCMIFGQGKVINLAHQSKVRRSRSAQDRNLFDVGKLGERNKSSLLQQEMR